MVTTVTHLSREHLLGQKTWMAKLQNPVLFCESWSSLLESTNKSVTWSVTLRVINTIRDTRWNKFGWGFFSWPLSAIRCSFQYFYIILLPHWYVWFIWRQAKPQDCTFGSAEPLISCTSIKLMLKLPLPLWVAGKVDNYSNIVTLLVDLFTWNLQTSQAHCKQYFSATENKMIVFFLFTQLPTSYL